MKNLTGVILLALVGASFVGCDDGDESTFEEGQGGSAGQAGSGGGAGVGGVTFLDSGGGSAGQSGGDATTGSCPDWGDDADCTACLKSNCCPEIAACDNNAGCKAFVECTRACSDPNNGTSQCVRDCAADAGASALDRWNAAVLCMGNPCMDACAHL